MKALPPEPDGEALGKAAVEAAAFEIAQAMAAAAPASWGYVLVLAARIAGGPCHYLSNLDRERQAQVLDACRDRLQRRL